MWAQSAGEVGKILAAARKHRGLTQTELSRAIGATQTWVSEVEQGKDTAQIGKILRALSYLGVRLQTGVVPWQRTSAASPQAKGISLSEVIAAHTGPKSRRDKT